MTSGRTGRIIVIAKPQRIGASAHADLRAKAHNNCQPEHGGRNGRVQQVRDRRTQSNRDANIAQTTKIQQEGEGVERETAVVEQHEGMATVQSTTVHWSNCAWHAWPKIQCEILKGKVDISAGTHRASGKGRNT